MYANANKHNRTYEHVSPLKKTCGHLSSWTPSIWDPWEILSTWVFSPLEISLSPCGSDTLSPFGNDKLWCDLSLPLWHQFPRRILWICCHMGLVLESQHKTHDKNVMLVEDKIHRVELDQKKHRICGKEFFLLWNRWHRVVCFGHTKKIRLDRKLQVGETEFTQRITLVTSAH